MLKPSSVHSFQARISVTLLRAWPLWVKTTRNFVVVSLGKVTVFTSLRTGLAGVLVWSGTSHHTEPFQNCVQGGTESAKSRGKRSKIGTKSVWSVEFVPIFVPICCGEEQQRIQNSKSKSETTIRTDIFHGTT
jgi:hypothetical protein